MKKPKFKKVSRRELLGCNWTDNGFPYQLTDLERYGGCYTLFVTPKASEDDILAAKKDVRMNVDAVRIYVVVCTGEEHE